MKSFSLSCERLSSGFASVEASMDCSIFPLLILVSESF